MKLRWKILLVFVALVVAINSYYLFTTPTNDGPWPEHYSKLAEIAINDHQVRINNFRRARYDNNGNAISVTWTERKLNLNNLESVWYGISVFASPGLAHTFLSFDFGDGDPVVFSVEARMRAEQSYHPLIGAFDNYHLIYVVADEYDVVGVRLSKRKEQVYFLPINVPKTRIQTMFLDMAERVNVLTTEPDFYNTFTSNCTNSIMKNTKVPAWQYYFDPRIILPGYSDRIAYEYGVLDKGFSRETIRQAAYLEPMIISDQDPQFSAKIRASYYHKLKAKN